MHLILFFLIVKKNFPYKILTVLYLSIDGTNDRLTVFVQKAGQDSSKTRVEDVITSDIKINYGLMNVAF